MVSRIRSRGACEVEQQSRVLMDLVLGAVAGVGADHDHKQNRVVIKVASAMLAALRSAPKEKTSVHLADLRQLDDAQFEQVIEGLRYVRESTRRLASRRKGGRPRTH